MYRRGRRTTTELEGGSWPGVADTLLAALMMTMLFWLGSIATDSLRVAMNANKPTEDQNREELIAEIMELRRTVDELKGEIARLRVDKELLAKKLDELSNDFQELIVEREHLLVERDRYKQELENLQRQLKEPPIIEVAEAQAISFEKGRAVISSAFQRRLEDDIFPEFVRILTAHEIVDTIEIIGHTDGDPMGGQSNIDGNLPAVLRGEAGVNSVSSGSNVDLGLMRALAIRELWGEWLKRKRGGGPRKVGVRCYSASFGVPPENPQGLKGQEFDSLARRIEIRFTKLAR
jgi:hypothetical protein